MAPLTSRVWKRRRMFQSSIVLALCMLTFSDMSAAFVMTRSTTNPNLVVSRSPRHRVIGREEEHDNNKSWSALDAVLHDTQNHHGVAYRPLEIMSIVPPLFLSIFGSFAAALLCITWEDCLCTHALPSRHVTLLAATPRSWGQSTVHGMGFGKDERLFLLHQAQAEQEFATNSIAMESDNQNDPENNPTINDASILEQEYQQRSYNEILLEHRQNFVPRWTTAATPTETTAAITTITSSLEKIWALQLAAEDYQWTTIRDAIRQAPLVNLQVAASQLPRSETIGFDWGSCAWRHCGALADTQEALDELDSLLGVLEPYEALFCMDIVERSLRDMLTAVPWDMAAPSDVAFYKRLPPYESKVRITEDSDDETSMIMQIDEAYFQALKDLRVND